MEEEDLEFRIVPLNIGENVPYARTDSFQEAGELLLEAMQEDDGIDYALKPVKVDNP